MKGNIRGIYLHYKKNYYEVIDRAIHTETNESLVVYRALYGNYGLFVRPEIMFFENIITSDGQSVPRFKLIKLLDPLPIAEYDNESNDQLLEVYGVNSSSTNFNE
jgi:hypothetical protein